MVGVALKTGGPIMADAEYVTEDKDYIYLKDETLDITGKFNKEFVIGYFKPVIIGDEDDEEYDD